MAQTVLATPRTAVNVPKAGCRKVTRSRELRAVPWKGVPHWVCGGLPCWKHFSSMPGIDRDGPLSIAAKERCHSGHSGSCVGFSWCSYESMSENGCPRRSNFWEPKDVSHGHRRYRSLISVLLVLKHETLHHFLGSLWP